MSVVEGRFHLVEWMGGRRGLGGVARSLPRACSILCHIINSLYLLLMTCGERLASLCPLSRCSSSIFFFIFSGPWRVVGFVSIFSRPSPPPSG